MAMDGFSAYRLKVDGLVARPLDLSLEQIRGLPSRTQITRHDCVEGWSAIGEWTGVAALHIAADGGPRGTEHAIPRVPLRRRSLLSGQGLYYESIDLIDAYHPQTIMAYAMNGRLCRSRTARRSACASNASSATRWRNTSCASRPRRASPISAAAAAASGKTSATNGMPGFEADARSTFAP